MLFQPCDLQIAKQQLLLLFNNITLYTNSLSRHHQESEKIQAVSNNRR